MVSFYEHQAIYINRVELVYSANLQSIKINLIISYWCITVHNY